MSVSYSLVLMYHNLLMQPNVSEYLGSFHSGAVKLMLLLQTALSVFPRTQVHPWGIHLGGEFLGHRVCNTLTASDDTKYWFSN